MFHCIGVTLRASLAPLLSLPLPGPPPPLIPRLWYPLVVWEGEAQKGGHGAGTLVTRGHPCPLAPRYRQPSAAFGSGAGDCFLDASLVLEGRTMYRPVISLLNLA